MLQQLLIRRATIKATNNYFLCLLLQIDPFHFISGSTPRAFPDLHVMTVSFHHNAKRPKVQRVTLRFFVLFTSARHLSAGCARACRGATVSQLFGWSRCRARNDSLWHSAYPVVRFSSLVSHEYRPHLHLLPCPLVLARCVQLLERRHGKVAYSRSLSSALFVHPSGPSEISSTTDQHPSLVNEVTPSVSALNQNGSVATSRSQRSHVQISPSRNCTSR